MILFLVKFSVTHDSDSNLQYYLHEHDKVNMMRFYDAWGISFRATIK